VVNPAGKLMSSLERRFTKDVAYRHVTPFHYEHQIMAIKDQVIVVTGAAQGIGECVAQNLSAQGAQLMLADIQAEKVAAVAETLGCKSVAVDISEPASAQAMIVTAIEHYGRVDSLVNVAGIDAPYVDALDVDEDHWRRLIDVDLNGPWWCTSAVLPHMIKQGGGRIVTISSIVAISAAPTISPAYSAAKSGLIGLVVGLSANVEKYGILVNAITPGFIGTTGTPTPDDEAARYSEDFALGMGGPQPVADAVKYLLDDSGRWISGVVMNVTGGLVRGR
jgi:NAD(P)-dependent dehydrogenase (short-subunit alcohol dehydrogenase family)